MVKTDFEKFMISNGVSSLYLHDYINKSGVYNVYQNPTILEERQLNVSQMDVFSRLMMDRIIFLGNPVTPDSANIIASQLLYLDTTDKKADIYLYINSPGGDVYSGLEIYDTMQLIRPDVSTICAGMAASMASILLCAGAEGKRCALKHSRVMIHQPMSGTGPHTQASDIEITCKEVNRLKNELYDIISTHSGQTLSRIKKDADRDFWMSSEEAKSYGTKGMIDKILTSK